MSSRLFTSQMGSFVATKTLSRPTSFSTLPTKGSEEPPPSRLVLW